MVLLAMTGVFPSGSVMLTARQGLLRKRLLIITGEEELTKLTTPERNCPSHELFLKMFRSTTGELPFPPIAAPKPPDPWALLRNTLPMMVGDVPSNMMPAPKDALPCWIVKPRRTDFEPSPLSKLTAVLTLPPSMMVRLGPRALWTL